MQEFYDSLPHVDSRFDRKRITEQFNNFLFAIFEATKSRNIAPTECSKIVGDKLRTSAEVGRMKNLQKILNIFRTQIHDIMDPHVSLLEESNFTPSRLAVAHEREQQKKEATSSTSRPRLPVKSTTKRRSPQARKTSRKLSEETSRAVTRVNNIWETIQTNFCRCEKVLRLLLPSG